MDVADAYLVIDQIACKVGRIAKQAHCIEYMLPFHESDSAIILERSPLLVPFQKLDVGERFSDRGAYVTTKKSQL